MRRSFEESIEACREAIAQGASREDVIDHLHKDGRGIIEAIKALRLLYGINLGKAKRLVSTHPSWIAIAHQTEPLHEAAEAAIEWLMSQ